MINKLNRHCPVCGVPVSDGSKTGYCARHVPRTGANNPFYGKHHKPLTEEQRKHFADKSREKWQDPEYRAKVIGNATGKKRTDEFKETQRANAIKQMQNPEQRKVRSASMKNTWKKGLIHWQKFSVNRSDDEKELFGELQKVFGDLANKNVIRWRDETGKKHWMFPDGCVFGNAVVEYNGDFWHGNPDKYSADDMVAYEVKASEVWNKDQERYAKMNQLGYAVIVVWESAWKRDRAACLKEIIDRLNWENCYEGGVYEIR